jgi:hypothetical protein
MANSRDRQAAELCRSAFEAEHQSRFQDAYQLHMTAITTLQQLADDASFLDRERKRIARKQIKFHGSRLEALRPIINGQQQSLRVVLPTSLSARESIMTMTRGGQRAISLVNVPYIPSLISHGFC